ncbi:Acetylornithine/succinyldiaminopimelate/putrescine aminotransferase [Fodinibius salinus]|uniref:Acetylornithine/succinyldiaminopimelate/putresci ne aminotransferase n=1 Tax=Fodinibius salinus TaxID=860790 RepID=A0A5D3YH46_9BACT|nr:aspartate aminotransferase family protein [Fodinibius salinus]TYP92741.1 Acetylornithine/succinyldiaminopimelate/putrescine aminotransferase [Fodinibius salinus]
MNNREKFYDHVAQTSDAPMGLEVDYAEGPYIYTTDGRQYVDFISGIAVSSLGHRHPKVVEAVKKQADQHLHVMVYGEFIQEPQSAYADLLTSQLPSSLDRVYFVNSGTEANEGALKLAKKHTGRHKFVAFNHGYHGDTHGSLSVTGRDVYQDPYKPLLPNVHFLDFNSFEALDTIDEQTAAVIMEPIQGEGGIIPAQKKWLKNVRQRCNEAGALLIFDEIQTGFYRTGSLFAFEQYDVVPDILCLAKAMGGGMPMGAFVSSSKIFESFMYNPPLNHVTTFGGHPVSCAAAHATLSELLSDDYGYKADQIESIARKELTADGISEVRGVGAMLGMELKNTELTRQVVEDCMDQGIILGWTLHSDTLVRLAPPLIIDLELLQDIFKKINGTIKKYCQQ